MYMYQVCSESNAQGEITSEQIALEDHYLKLFFDIVFADVDTLFASLHPPSEGGGEVVLGDGLDDPSQLF